jgi:hypothetical protein
LGLLIATPGSGTLTLVMVLAFVLWILGFSEGSLPSPLQGLFCGDGARRNRSGGRGRRVKSPADKVEQAVGAALIAAELPGEIVHAHSCERIDRS